MKFELIEMSKQYSSSELIEDLKRVANELEKRFVSQREYNRFGNFSYQTFKKRFGSWKSALEKAGLNQSKRSWGGDLSETRIPEDLLITDMQRVVEELKKQAITMADYDQHGKFGSSTICKRFGGWNKAKTIAKLKIGRIYNSTDEDYFENIAEVWRQLGRQPKYKEMIDPLSKLHISSYERKYGTWRNALEKFIEYINSKDRTEEQETIKTSEKKPVPIFQKSRKNIDEKEVIKKRTNRTANLRQRFKVMKRDGFKCILCGSSPATQISCELHIDHIIPWSHGGETVEENLRTLCSNCNLGRSNKE
jgi:hypothetical protein